MKTMTDRVADAEERIYQVEERDEAVSETLTQLLQQQKKLTDRVDYLENKARQLNIRINQVKEGSEGDDMLGLKTLISDNLGIPGQDLDIVQAHRAFTNSQAPEQLTSWPIIVCFL